jgi:hypothetical protein
VSFEDMTARIEFYRRRNTHGDVVWVVGIWHDAQIPDDPA